MRMAKVKHIGTLENWHIEYRGISSVGLEHLPCTQGVIGSSPIFSTNNDKRIIIQNKKRENNKSAQADLEHPDFHRESSSVRARYSPQIMINVSLLIRNKNQIK